MRMTTLKKAAMGALLMAGATLAIAPSASAGVAVGVSIGGPGYVDPCYGPYPYPTYCTYPVFYGPVFYAGRWHNGVHRYRVINGHRHYWVGGGWRSTVRVGHGRFGGARHGDHHRGNRGDRNRGDHDRIHRHD